MKRRLRRFIVWFNGYAHMPENFLEVGTLLRPQGLKGEVRMAFYADSPELLNGAIWLQAAGRPPRPVRATSWRFSNGRMSVAVEGVNDRTAAAALRGQSVLIEARVLPAPGPEEVYLHRMLGLSVLLHATGEPLGVLDHVLFHGEQELWSIRTAADKEILLPAVPEFVDLIDTERGIIRVSPPEGLIELYVGKP